MNRYVQILNLFNKHESNIYHVPDTILEIGNSAVSQMDKVFHMPIFVC